MSDEVLRELAATLEARKQAVPTRYWTNCAAAPVSPA